MSRSSRSSISTSVFGVTATGLGALLALSMTVGAQQPPQQQVPPIKKAVTPTPKPVVRQVQPKAAPKVVSKPGPTQIPKREVTKITKSPGGSGGPSQKAPAVTKVTPKVIPSNPSDPKKVADPSKILVKPGKANPTGPGAIDPKKVADPSKLPLKGGTPGPTGPGAVDPKKVADPSKLPLKGGTAGPTGPGVPGPNATKLPLGSKVTIPAQPAVTPGTKVGIPGGLPGAKVPANPAPLVLYKPAKGISIKPMLPPKINPSKLVLWKPAKPPLPAPKLIGPAWFQPAPKFSWYPWGGKKYFPYFFVGTIVTGAVVVAGYNYWTPPPPSCYAGGSTVYYYPGTRICYDFSVARENDDFECHGKVFKYRPSRYRTVETMIESEGSSAVPVTTWLEKEPERKVQVQAAIDRAAARAKTVAAAPTETLDCSACLAALGPTEGEDGQATVSVVNNCDHDITVSGGLTKTGATADTPAVCEFQGDVPAGQEVVACTKPTSDFAEAQVFLNAVVPVEGTAKPAPACRIPDQPKAN